jgi:nickel-dependent lactate racemase
LPYGDTHFTVEVPEANLLGVITPKVFANTHPAVAGTVVPGAVAGIADPGAVAGIDDPGSEEALLRQALAHPIGSPRLHDIAHTGQRVTIVTSDVTRPCPSARMLPYILEELNAAGVSDKDIFIVIGLGIHRPMTGEEIDQIVSPEIHRRIQVLNHNKADTVRLGVTSRGTPAEFFRPVVEADLRLCLGNLEFHWFAGYSGGAKAILPGVASHAAIIANHTLMTHPGVGGGLIQGNPLREDIEEAVAMLGVDFILNVVVDGEHRILAAVAGDLTAAHRQGCQLIDARGRIRVPRPADIVIASAGGFPKDINMFQAHKGMRYASDFTRLGGILILVAECREGLGNPVFESWMMSASSPAEILVRSQHEFAFGGHKAVNIAAIESRMPVFLISALPDDLVRRIFMTPFTSPQAALQAALNKLGPESQVFALPQAGSVLAQW